MLESKKLNAFFNECFKLNIQTTLDPDLLKYYYELYGVWDKYLEFEAHVLSKYGSKGGGIFAAKDQMVFSVLKEIVVKPIYHEFANLGNFGSASSAQVLFALIEKGQYDDFKNKLIPSVYEGVTLFSELKDKIEYWELDDSFKYKPIDKKMRDINQFIQDWKTKNKFDRSQIDLFLEFFYNQNKDYFDLFKQDVDVASNFFSTRFANHLVTSVDLKKANHQSLFHLGIIDELDFDKYISKHTDDPYLKLNKNVRQVIYGNLNSKRIGTFQRVIMTRLYHFMKNRSEHMDAFIRSDDELVVTLPEGYSSTDYGLYEDFIDDSLTDIESIFNDFIQFNVEEYRLKYLDTNKGFMYYKSYIGDSFELKGVNSKYYPQIFKLLQNKAIEEKDLMFEDKDTKSIVRFVEPLKIIN